MPHWRGDNAHQNGRLLVSVNWVVYEKYQIVPVFLAQVVYECIFNSTWWNLSVEEISTVKVTATNDSIDPLLLQFFDVHLNITSTKYKWFTVFKT